MYELLGSRISSCWGCAEIWGLHLFVYSPWSHFFCFLWSLLGQREQVIFHAKESISGTSKCLVCLCISWCTLDCCNSCRGARNMVMFLSSFFLVCVWRTSGRSLSCLGKYTKHVYWFISLKFPFCTLSGPHQTFPVSDVLGSAFQTIWIASFRKKPWIPLWCPCNSFILRKAFISGNDTDRLIPQS